jgi:SET domain-containing protein
MTTRRKNTTTPWAERRKSTIHGRGLYATKTIPAETRIIAYDGELITKAESDRREEKRLAREASGRDGCVYIFQLNKRHDIDGSMAWNSARLINHSCKPNCRAEIIRGKIWIIAKREIPEGAELTFDYRYGFSNWREHPCRCGTDRCVGFIVAAEYRWRVRKILKAERVEAKKADRKGTGVRKRAAA